MNTEIKSIGAAILIAAAAATIALTLPKSAAAEDAIVTPLGTVQMMERTILIQTANELVMSANTVDTGGYMTPTEKTEITGLLAHLSDDFAAIDTAGATGDLATFDKLADDALQTEGAILADLKAAYDEGAKKSA